MTPGQPLRVIEDFRMQARKARGTAAQHHPDSFNAKNAELHAAIYECAAVIVTQVWHAHEDMKAALKLSPPTPSDTIGPNPDQDSNSRN